jgi:hypothetical protein
MTAQVLIGLDQCIVPCCLIPEVFCFSLHRSLHTGSFWCMKARELYDYDL